MLEKLKKSIDKGLVSVSVKSSTYLEIEKVKAKITNIQAANSALMKAMGEQIYQTWKDSREISREYIEGVCREIAEKENEIQICSDQIAQLEHEKEQILKERGNPVPAPGEDGILCSCGKMNDKNAKFCKSCGKKLEKPEPPAAPQTCPNCHAELEEGARFCSECGTTISN